MYLKKKDCCLINMQVVKTVDPGGYWERIGQVLGLPSESSLITLSLLMCAVYTLTFSPLSGGYKANPRSPTVTAIVQP